jgi:hypothetical protein
LQIGNDIITFAAEQKGSENKRKVNENEYQKMKKMVVDKSCALMIY